MVVIWSSERRCESFSTSAVAFMKDHISGSFAATRTFQRRSWMAKSGSPVKGSAMEENLSRRSTLNSKASQPLEKTGFIEMTRTGSNPRQSFAQLVAVLVQMTSAPLLAVGLKEPSPRGDQTQYLPSR